jgi:hypothetical protein
MDHPQAGRPDGRDRRDAGRDESISRRRRI